jgi:ion channel-forming bestrophin family protein
MLLKKNIPLSYVFGKIKWEVLLVTLYAVTIAVLYHNFHFTRISIPLSVPMILGTVISLLLAFRSNQAYDRWWEARTIWGAIVNDSRSLGRQVMAYIDNSFDPDGSRQFQERFLKRQMAWNFALSQRLRGTKATAGLERLLSKRELTAVARYDNAPAALLELHARDLVYALEQGWLNQYQQVEIDRTLTRLCDAMGKCERIKNTVFPATYSLYIHLAMNFFILMLPFALIDFFGFIEVPLVIVIAALFMLIEKMAIHLQDPFENKPTDTPMTTISSNIERDLRQMLNDHLELPENTTADSHKGYYML